jgi:alkanesulfonate monooxygenase SsuD/methylene tetrahydromethanopterin reductase-like flavin-dependent oxidoreductase (luciferase family)
METKLAGRGSNARVTGAYAGDGSQHLDYDTTQEHAAPNTTSDLAFRGVLAKQALTIDHATNGRVELGIGAGWYEDEYDAMGVEFPDIATRNRQMRETIELCRAMWNRESPVSWEGEHYELDGFYCDPKPDGIPVLIGGGGEELTLRATSEYADRWNIPSGDPGRFAGKLDVLRDHCEEMGTDYDAITKTVGNTTVLRETTEAAHEAYEDLQSETEDGPTPRGEDRGVVGTPAEAAERIEAFGGAGADQFILMVPLNDRRTVELFVDEVMGAV